MWVYRSVETVEFFEFEDSPEREKLITDFYSGNLTQNVREYVNQWVNFKRLVARLSSSNNKGMPDELKQRIEVAILSAWEKEERSENNP